MRSSEQIVLANVKAGARSRLKHGHTLVPYTNFEGWGEWAQSTQLRYLIVCCSNQRLTPWTRLKFFGSLRLAQLWAFKAATHHTNTQIPNKDGLGLGQWAYHIRHRDQENSRDTVPSVRLDCRFECDRLRWRMAGLLTQSSARAASIYEVACNAQETCLQARSNLIIYSKLI